MSDIQSKKIMDIQLIETGRLNSPYKATKHEVEKIMDSVRDFSLEESKKPQSVSPVKKDDPIEIELQNEENDETFTEDTGIYFENTSDFEYMGKDSGDDEDFETPSFASGTEIEEMIKTLLHSPSPVNRKVFE
jgi:hypothetical protein